MFMYIDSTNTNYKFKTLASKKEIEEINKYQEVISKISKFYEKNFSEGSIDYIYKDGKNIKLMPVKYKKREVKQAQRIGVNRAIKTKENDLLLALYDFQPEIFEPKSLLNIKEAKQYDNIPENTVLAIFKESQDKNTIHMEPISLNTKALGSIENSTKMLIAVGMYTKEQSNLLEKQQIKKRKIAKLRQRGMER